MGDKTNKRLSSGLKIVGTVVSLLVILITFISWAANTGLQSEQNRDNIDKLSGLIADECQVRMLEDKELAGKIEDNKLITEKGLAEIKVKLAGIDTKLDVNLTYITKSLDTMQGIGE